MKRLFLFALCATVASCGQPTPELEATPFEQAKANLDACMATKKPLMDTCQPQQEELECLVRERHRQRIKADRSYTEQVRAELLADYMGPHDFACPGYPEVIAD